MDGGSARGARAPQLGLRGGRGRVGGIVVGFVGGQSQSSMSLQNRNISHLADVAGSTLAIHCRYVSRGIEHMRPEELGIGELFGRIREAVIVADATTQRIVLWNPAATNIFGYSISEALELTIEKLVPEPLKTQHRAGITRYAKTGHGPYIDSQRLLELPALTKSGEEIYVELSLSPIGLVDDTNGGRRFVLAIVRDVTERKWAEEALRHNEERFRLLVEGVKDYAIFMLDPEGKVASWNEGAHRIKGYRHQEIVGRHFSVFYPEEDVKRSKPERALEIAKEKGTYEEEGWRVRKDGSRFWASVSITALWDEGGGLRGFAKVTRDITERKRAEEEIQRLNETLEELKDLVGKLVLGQEEEQRRVAYEVHEGLAQVASAAHLRLATLSHRGSPDTQRSQADLEQALKLIQQTISDARRISANLRPTVLDDFGLPAAISLEVQRLREEGYQVEYEEGFGDERLPAMAENALFRIVQEALTNIQKHSQTRKIRIEVRRQEDEVYLEVRDYGRGFDLEATSPGSELGRTVGIARMREWALLLGGQLKIHTKPGRGTSVVAKVPLAAHEGTFRSRSEIP
jgi:PAS domain S-box-containing protein